MQRQQNLINDLIRAVDGLQNLNAKMQIHNSYKIHNNMNTSYKHFQQLVLQQISELLHMKKMQIHNNYKMPNNMNTSDKHFQQLLLQQIA